MNFSSFFRKPKKTTLSQISTLLFCIVLMSSCGKKQKNIFNFSRQEIQKINKLVFPPIKGARATHMPQGIQLTWHPIKTVQLKKVPYKTKLIGYNVFRLTRYRFVPKKPLNGTPVIKEEFLDTINKAHKKTYCYFIRGVFQVEKKIIQGPGSQIVYSPKYQLKKQIDTPNVTPLIF